MIAAGIVAVFLLLMVVLGLTGVLWQNVTQRTPEIGLRRAMGAPPGRHPRQILGELLVITTMAVSWGRCCWPRPVPEPGGLMNAPST